MLSTFLYPVLGRVPDWHQVDRYLEFRIALILPHPRLPAPSLAMAGFQYLSHANTLLLQDYQIQLQLRSVELHRGLRENVISPVASMDVLEKDLLRKLRSVENRLIKLNGSFSSHHKSESLDQHRLCNLLF